MESSGARTLRDLTMSAPDGLHLEIYEFLLENFAGVDNAAPRAAIIQRFGLVRKRDINDRAFRQIVSELVTLYKKAICTTPEAGYYVARTGKELDAAVNHLRAIGAANFDRAKALAATEPLERQERLF